MKILKNLNVNNVEKNMHIREVWTNILKNVNNGFAKYDNNTIKIKHYTFFTFNVEVTVKTVNCPGIEIFSVQAPTEHSSY